MIISFILGLVIGFIAGLLTFKNNQVKADKLVSDAQATLEADKAKAKHLLDALKGK